MLVRLLAGPCLARLSSFGLALSSSVVCSIASEFLATFFLFRLFINWSNKRVTIAPHDFRISGIAPGRRLAIRVSAIVMIA